MILAEGPPLFKVRIPLFNVAQSPFRLLIRMTKVATIRVALPDRHRRRDEVERMVPRFRPNRVLPRLRHVAVDALAPRARNPVMRMIRQNRVVRPHRLPRTVAVET